jgi:hypothetical protein
MGHCDDDRVAFDGRTIHGDAGDPAALAGEPGDAPRAERCPLGFGRAHHGRSELAGVDLRGGLDRAETLGEGKIVREPGKSPAAAGPRAGIAAVGVEAAIAPVVCSLLGEARMESEAAPREGRKGRAIAPVQGEKTARLAGRRVGNASPLNDDGFRPAPGEEPSNRGADDATAADQDTHGPSPPNLA